MGRTAGTRGTFTVRAMADALGISKSECHRDKQAGMPMHAVDAARDWRAQTHDVSRSAEGRIDRPQLRLEPNSSVAGTSAGAEVTSQASAPAAALQAPVVEPDDALPAIGDTAEYREARAQREKVRLETDQVNLAKLKGALIDVEEASRCAFTAFRGLRDAVLNVPARIKDQLAAETDSFRVEQLLADELGAALAGFKVEGAVRDLEQDDEED